MTSHDDQANDEVTADAVRFVRTIGAPPGEVYRAFLEPDLICRWFGPGGFTVIAADVDARIGGRHHTIVAGPDGVRGRFVGEIRALTPAERIEMTWSWVPDNPAAGVIPQQGSLLSITLRASGPATTELTLVHSQLGGSPDEDPTGIRTAWSEALDKLAAVPGAAPVEPRPTR